MGEKSTEKKELGGQATGAVYICIHLYTFVYICIHFPQPNANTTITLDSL